jgi:type IV secretory pathway VirB2 component (pilin)
MMKANIKHYLTAFILLLPALAFAGEDGDSPVAQGLRWIINEMYGGTSITIATLSIMSVGLLCFGKIIEWKYLLYTVGGIAILFGAGPIVDGIKALIH